MTNNTSTFTPSTQILEAAEKAQALADAGKPIARFLSPEIQETVDGVQKIANALNSTGKALRHFGFDEAEPEVTTSEIELIPTDDLQIVDNMNPTFADFVPDSLRPSTYVIEGGQVLQENGWTGTGQAIETAGHVMRAFGYDEAEADGLTRTAPTMPAFDTVVDTIPETWEPGTNYEFTKPKPVSEAMKETSGIVGAAAGIVAAPAPPLGVAYGAAAGVLYLGGAIAGAFGFDVDASEPYISEVGVDSLA